MSDSAISTNPVLGFSSYFGNISNMPNRSCGCINPNDLHHDGQGFFIQRGVRVECLRWANTPLVVFKVDDEFHVWDEHVHVADRWWDYKYIDTFRPSKRVYVSTIVRGDRLLRPLTPSGRIVGSSRWHHIKTRYAGPLELMPFGAFGFVDVKQLKRDMRQFYLLHGSFVSPTPEREVCLQVGHLHDGLLAFDGEVPPRHRWWYGTEYSNFAARFQTNQPTPVCRVLSESN